MPKRYDVDTCLSARLLWYVCCDFAYNVDELSQVPIISFILDDK